MSYRPSTAAVLRGTVTPVRTYYCMAQMYFTATLINLPLAGDINFLQVG